MIDIQPEMKMYPLTDVQYSFLYGRSKKDSFFGESCHIHIEIKEENYNADKGKMAWCQTVSRHESLNYKIMEMGVAVYDDTHKTLGSIYHYNSNAGIIEDKFRENLFNKNLDIEEGELATLNVLLYEAYAILFFDFDCIGYDVTSVQIFLRDYFQVYDSESLSVLPEKYNPYLVPFSKEKNVIDEEYWNNKLVYMNAPVQLPVVDDFHPYFPTKYRSIRCFLEEYEVKKISEYALKKEYTTEEIMLGIYIISLADNCNQTKCAINIPYLTRDKSLEEYKECMGEFTRIFIYYSTHDQKKSFEERIEKIISDYRNDKRHLSYSGLKVQKKIRAEISDIIFSSHLEMQLIQEKEGRVLNNIISRTAGVLLDGEFFRVGNRILWNFVVPDKYFPDGTIEKILKYMSYILSEITE